jgi:penicillin-binding protein 2
VDARRALQSSCDVWYYKVADTLGLDPIARVGDEFGLGQPTGIGVVSEVPGIMPDSEFHNRVNKSTGGYQKGMALNSAMGQGAVTVTPMQMALVYAAIANGGDVFVPQLVRAIEDPSGREVQRFEPKVARHVEMTPEQRKVLVEGLVAVVNEPGGTAYRTRLTDVKVAGKTGTAQVVRLGSVRLKTHQMEYWQRDHAWFAGFAPAEDPEIAVVVLNEHGGHGGTDAAPTAMALLRRYFELKREKALSEQGLTLPESVQFSAQEVPEAPARRAPAAARPPPQAEPSGSPAAPTPAAPTPAAVAPAVEPAAVRTTVASTATGLTLVPVPLVPALSPSTPAAPAAGPRAVAQEH